MHFLCRICSLEIQKSMGFSPWFYCRLICEGSRRPSVCVLHTVATVQAEACLCLCWKIGKAIRCLIPTLVVGSGVGVQVALYLIIVSEPAISRSHRCWASLLITQGRGPVSFGFNLNFSGLCVCRSPSPLPSLWLSLTQLLCGSKTANLTLKLVCHCSMALC